MSTSRAIVLEDVERMSLRSFDVPEVGPDEALLRIEMAGVCGTDYKYYHGKLTAPMPIILGHEILGRIAAIGERAAQRYGVQVGDRVEVEGAVPCYTCEWCLTGAYRFCKSRRGYGTRTSVNEAPGLWGAMAEYMYLAPGTIMHKVPDSVPVRAAAVASILANGIYWLRERGGVTVGDTVLIQGCGPQGLAGTVIGRESGAKTVIVTGLAKDAGRLQLAREFGADHVIVADQEDVVARVKNITNGHMADVVLDVSGSPRAILTSVQSTRPLGTLVLGGLTGNGVETPMQMDLLTWNEIRVQGVFTKGAKSVSAAIDFLTAGGQRYPLDRMISHVYPLEGAEEAIRISGGGGGEDFVKAAVVP